MDNLLDELDLNKYNFYGGSALVNLALAIRPRLTN